MAKLIEITGKALSGEWGTDDETGEGIPVLRTTNFTNEGVVDYNNVVTRIIAKKNIEEKYLRKGDIIIEKSGGSDKQPVGRVIYFDGPENVYLFNNFTGLLRIKDKNVWNPKYVFYSLYANYRRGGTRSFENKTTGLHNLKTDDYVARYEIKEVNFDYQKEVCEQLDRISDVIKLRQKKLLKLDDLIKARFVELFGTSTPNDIDGENYVSVASVCSSMMIGPFGSALHKPEMSTSGEVFVLGTDNAVKNEFAVKEERFISSEKYSELTKYTVKSGDIIITMMGTIGRVAVIPDGFHKAIISSHLSCLTPDYNVIYPRFLHAVLTLDDGISLQIAQQKKGAIMSGLNLGIIKNLRFKMVDKDKQKVFLDFIEQVDKSKVVC